LPALLGAHREARVEQVLEVAAHRVLADLEAVRRIGSSKRVFTTGRSIRLVEAGLW